MHLRRALLLFAIVLGLAAVAASVSRPPEQTGTSDRAERPTAPPATEAERTPTVAPGTAPRPAVELSFDAERDQTRRLATGQPASVLVEVDEPGQVEIRDLGLSGFAEPLTPARFELFVSDPGRHEITFTPVDGDVSGVAGSLVVEAAER